MKTLDVAQVGALMGQYLANPDQQPIILTTNGKPLAVVLPAGGADVETISLSLSPTFLAIMERSRIRHAIEGGISSEEMRRYFGVEPYVERNAKTTKSKGNRTKPQAKGPKGNGAIDGSQV